MYGINNMLCFSPSHRRRMHCITTFNSYVACCNAAALQRPKLQAGAMPAQTICVYIYMCIQTHTYIHTCPSIYAARAPPTGLGQTRNQQTAHRPQHAPHRPQPAARHRHADRSSLVRRRSLRRCVRIGRWTSTPSPSADGFGVSALEASHPTGEVVLPVTLAGPLVCGRWPSTLGF